MHEPIYYIKGGIMNSKPAKGDQDRSATKEKEIEDIFKDLTPSKDIEIVTGLLPGYNYDNDCD